MLPSKGEEGLVCLLFSPPDAGGSPVGCHSAFPALELTQELAGQSQTQQKGFLVGRSDAFRVVNSEEAVKFFSSWP